MDFARKSYDIFERSVYDYHIDDDVDAATRQPFDASTIEGVLYAKTASMPCNGIWRTSSAIPPSTPWPRWS